MPNEPEKFYLQVKIPYEINQRIMEEKRARGLKRKEELVTMLLVDAIERLDAGQIRPLDDFSKIEFERLQRAVEDLKNRVDRLEYNQSNQPVRVEVEDDFSAPASSYHLVDLLSPSFPRLRAWAEEEFGIKGDSKEDIIKQMVLKGITILDQDTNPLDFTPKVICENIWCQKEGHESTNCTTPDPNANKTLHCDNCGSRKRGKVCPRCTKKGPKPRPQCQVCLGYHPEGKCKGI